MAGYLEKRGKDSWRLTVSHGYDSFGNRIRYTKAIKSTSKRDAEKQLDLYVSEIENGMVLKASSIRLNNFVTMWEDNYAKNELAPTTYSGYKCMLKNRIIPYFGHYKLDEIKPLHIMKFYDYLSKDRQKKKCKNQNEESILKGLSQKTILEYHRLLRAMFQNAVYWQLLPYNPFTRVRPPKARKPKISFYDDKQSTELINALSGEEIKFQTIVILTLYTGMRRGEVMGLEWEDIDMLNKLVHIKQSSQYLPGKGIFVKDPKTETSVREIAISDIVVKALSEYKAWYNQRNDDLKELWIDSKRVFIQWNGEAMHPDTISKWFSKFIKRKNLPHLTFHGLRHTNATLLVAGKVDIPTVASRLGHAQQTTTMNFYVHPIKEHNQKAAETLEKILCNY